MKTTEDLVQKNKIKKDVVYTKLSIKVLKNNIVPSNEILLQNKLFKIIYETKLSLFSDAL